MQKIIVIGAKGMLGSAVTAFFVEKNIKVIGVDKSDDFDFTKKDDIKELLEKIKPDVVINCAAYTDVDGCETEEGFAIAGLVNSQAPIDLVEICLDLDITCIHISTDYVFSDNSESGYAEDSILSSAINKYGQTKLDAERGIIELCGGLEGSDFKNKDSKIYVIRISWLFGEGGANFIQKIIAKSKTELELSVVDDEVGCPTYTVDIVKAMDNILENNLNFGIYHVISCEVCSRYDLAKYLLDKISPEVRINKSKLADFSRKAVVPNFSILKNTKLPKQRHWEEMVDDFLGKS